MKLGTISTEISARSAAELFGKAKNYGFSQMQLNYKSFADEELPAFIPDSLCREIADEAGRNGIEIAALTGTFNMAHPELSVRRNGIERFEKTASTCAFYGCKLITLCTGSRNRQHMWSPHPDNNSSEAWKDMTEAMEQLILIADRYGLFLGVEPEASNVINSPAKAKKLIEEMKSPRIKIIFDAANLFHEGMAKRKNVRSVIAGAIELLAPWIVIAHGKDIKEGEGISFTCAGRGIIDFDFFLRELERIGYRGGIILHGVKDEKDIPGCVEFIKGRVIEVNYGVT